MAGRNIGNSLKGPVALLAGGATVLAIGGVGGYALRSPEAPANPAAADTSQFVPPSCDTMPNTHGWELPLCQKMATIGRNILAAYNDGDVRDNGAYAWKLTPQTDGFSLNVAGELPGSYSARYHRLTTGVQLVEVQETMQVTDALQKVYRMETEPITSSPQSQLRFTVTKPGASPVEAPVFLFDSHTQAADTSANTLAAEITPIVAQNGVIAVQ